jgi:hypothetical protein
MVAVAFSVCAAVGVGTHWSYLNFFIASPLWSLWRLWGRRFRQLIKPFLSCFAFPALVYAVVFLVDVRFLVNGAGRTDFTIIGTFGEAIAWTCGVSAGNAVSIWAAVAAIAGLLYASQFWRDEMAVPLGILIIFRWRSPSFTKLTVFMSATS